MANAAIDMDHLAGDVARARRAEEGDEHREVLGLADIAGRAMRGGPGLLRLARGQDALVDLLGMDATRRDRVHRHAVARDEARERLGPYISMTVPI